MSDIVERLSKYRSQCDCDEPGCPPCTLANDCRVAGAEIERLRRELDHERKCAEAAMAFRDRESGEVERLRGMMVEAARLAYLEGHNDTVESRFGDPLETAVDLIADLRDIIFEEAEDIRDARAALAVEVEP